MRRTSLRYVALAILFQIWSMKLRAADPPNYGQLWNGWTAETRFAYVKGFSDGLIQGWIFTKKRVNARARVPDTWILGFDEATVGQVMDELYRDPSNTFISLPGIALIARAKLGGENIEERLRNSRRAAVLLQRSAEQKN